MESPNQPQGPAIGSEIVVVIIPIDSNCYVRQFLVNSMLLKAPKHKFPCLETSNQPWGPVIGLEIFVVIIPIDSNPHVWHCLFMR